MKKKNLFYLMTVLIMAVSISACGKKEETADNAKTLEEAFGAVTEDREEKMEEQTEAQVELQAEEKAGEQTEGQVEEQTDEKEAAVASPEREEFNALVNGVAWDFSNDLNVLEYISEADGGNYYAICEDNAGNVFVSVMLFNMDTLKIVYTYEGEQYPVIGLNAIDASQTSYTIPDNFIALYNCQSPPMTEVIIPDSVTMIGNKAFAYCGELAEITIPDSVTKVGPEAFDFSEKLASITYKENVYTSVSEFMNALGD